MNRKNLPSDIKPIPGYVGYYISKKGEVYSDFIIGGHGYRDNTLHKKAVVIRKDGYVKVDLYINFNEKVTKNIHRLVAFVFIPNPHCLPEVGHVDGIRAHNYVGNLYWCTHLKNMEDAKRMGRTTAGEKNAMAKLTQKDVDEMRRLYRTGDYTFRKLGVLFKINKKRVSMIINNKSWSG